MKRYFTSITITSEGYIGQVFDPNTNQAVYSTKAYPQQIGATADVANYLKGATNLPSAQPDQVHTPTPQPQVQRRKCCGRQ